MSEPGGSSRLCVGNEGTQRMVGGEVDPRSYANEEISSSSFEDIPFRVDPALTIFGKYIPFLPMYEFRFLP